MIYKGIMVILERFMMADLNDGIICEIDYLNDLMVFFL